MGDFFEREIELKSGELMTIAQQYVADVGGVVWDAALVLNAYLESIDLTDKFIVELGAGTGVSGQFLKLN